MPYLWCSSCKIVNRAAWNCFVLLSWVCQYRMQLHLCATQKAVQFKALLTLDRTESCCLWWWYLPGEIVTNRSIVSKCTPKNERKLSCWPIFKRRGEERVSKSRRQHYRIRVLFDLIIHNETKRTHLQTTLYMVFYADVRQTECFPDSAVCGQLC